METSVANQRLRYRRITLTVRPPSILLGLHLRVRHVRSYSSVAYRTECWDICRTRRGRYHVLKKAHCLDECFSGDTRVVVLHRL
jgi:hypothetical protein